MTQSPAQLSLLADGSDTAFTAKRAGWAQGPFRGSSRISTWEGLGAVVGLEGGACSEGIFFM